MLGWQKSQEVSGHGRATLGCKAKAEKIHHLSTTTRQVLIGGQRKVFPIIRRHSIKINIRRDKLTLKTKCMPIKSGDADRYMTAHAV